MSSESLPDDTSLRSEIVRLRRIMYEPGAVWLLSEAGGAERWLTDKYVMLRVTDNPALTELADGAYKLPASGTEVKPRETVETVDLDAWFEKFMGREWYAATPSEWSVAEHPGKAQLWTYDTWVRPGVEYDRHPCLLGEPTWTQLKRHHPDALVEYAPEGNVFRLKDDGVPFCFAAGIRVPDGQERVAEYIAQAVDTTSNPALDS